jgi:acyl-CoA dehydrogenase
VEKCLYDIQLACDELLNNFPKPILGKLLHWIIFPFGTAYRRPKDSLYHKIVEPMLEPSALRDRLTRHFYISHSPNDSTSLIEKTFAKISQVEPIWKKFQNALRSGTLLQLDSFEERLDAAVNLDILTQDEADALREFDRLSKEVIKVDEFSFDLNTVLS